MSVLANAGRAKLYATDGTGRDSYVALNNGGFTTMNSPAIQQRSSNFGPSTQRNARADQQISPRPNLYHVNGTGRDSYIATNHGGQVSNYNKFSSGEAYQRSLREYEPTIQERLRDCQNQTRNRRDAFLQGQGIITSPKARYGMTVLSKNQRSQADRLSMPRQNSHEALPTLNSPGRAMPESPSKISTFLRRTSE